MTLEPLSRQLRGNIYLKKLFRDLWLRLVELLRLLRLAKLCKISIPAADLRRAREEQSVVPTILAPLRGIRRSRLSVQGPFA